MVLKNRDGTPFRVSSPNPLMAQQRWLDKADIVFHNFTWQGILIPDKPLTQRRFQEAIVLPQNATPTITPLPQNTTPIEEIKAEETEDTIPDKVIENAIVVHCLPLLKWKSKQDGLYGDIYKTPVYGEKSTFEAVMIEKADLAISLWVSDTLKSKDGIVDTAQYLKPGSIVFPVKYVSGGKIRDHRWWKVEKTSPFDKGVLIVAAITDIQPSFAN